MILYSSDLAVLNSLTSLEGFFVGWPNPPTDETLKRILRGSFKAIIAYEDRKLIGFINCISDGILSAYIPLLEVLPAFQGKGIGKQLVLTMKDELHELYMIDLLCDENLIPYYEKLGMRKAQGACFRNFDKQSGRID